MRYLALGDSISIDLYTGVAGGGAVSQFAAGFPGCELTNLCYDGCTTEGVLRKLDEAPLQADLITVTVGGNDLLGGFFHRIEGDRGGFVLLETLFANLTLIADRVAAYKGTVIMNAVYDPSDGDDTRGFELGLLPEARNGLSLTNTLIRRLCEERGFLFADLQALFAGHGAWSADSWFVQQIEPSHQGATEIAKEWSRLYRLAAR